MAGADATDDFNAIHSARAKGMLKQYIIGRVGQSTGGDGKPEQAPVDKEVSPLSHTCYGRGLLVSGFGWKEGHQLSV